MDTLLMIEGHFPLKEIERYLDLLGVDRQGCLVSDSEALKKPGTYSHAVLFLTRPLDRPQLMTLLERLSPGADVVFAFPETVRQATTVGLKSQCILSGYLPTEDDFGDMRLLKMRKPEWKVGAASVVPVAASSNWTVQLDDELLDDDDFLTEEDSAPVLPGGKAPVKKACENCTCGRAEGKEPAKLTQAMLDNPITSCGSCGLGDAYRCASCPYRGLPSFEPGKKIELPEGFLVPDL